MGDAYRVTSSSDGDLSERADVRLPASTRAMTRRHFTLQDDRPDGIAEVGLDRMDPPLRSLFFTDGTVTRALEVQALARVFVDVVAQADSVTSGSVADYLETPEGLEAKLRRVMIGTRPAVTPIIWAESHILPTRLPPAFLSTLAEAPDGIGQSLQQVKLESWRDMLWFGLDSPPDWSGIDANRSMLRRVYRVIAGGQPALLISECFAVTCRDGVYSLASA
jgi:chorismate-pyruvate lyase